MEYTKIFEFAKAYADLGVKEKKIIEYLFVTDFKGGYTKLAKKINMDVSNLRNTIKYLDALSIVYIGYEKYIDKLEVKQNKNGKNITSHNHMKYCFIVDGWMDILIRQYQNGNIFHDENSKKIFVNKMNKLIFNNDDN